MPIEDDANRNLTLYRYIIPPTHTRAYIYIYILQRKKKKKKNLNWTRRSHEKLTVSNIIAYSISRTIHLNHHFHEQLRAQRITKVNAYSRVLLSNFYLLSLFLYRIQSFKHF